MSQDSKEVLLAKGTLIDEDIVDSLDEKNIYEIKVRSAIHCNTIHGICAKCYGRDLGRGHKVDIGESVGIVAAQSIGEPGTQLTMRTFHIGGAASGTSAEDNIVTNFPGKVVKKYQVIKFVPGILPRIPWQSSTRLQSIICIVAPSISASGA